VLSESYEVWINDQVIISNCFLKELEEDNNRQTNYATSLHKFKVSKLLTLLAEQYKAEEARDDVNQNELTRILSMFRADETLTSTMFNDLYYGGKDHISEHFWYKAYKWKLSCGVGATANDLEFDKISHTRVKAER
jgi:hypothetical protein